MARVPIPNLDQVKAGFDPLPANIYLAKITKGDIKDGPNGQYIAWEFEIIEGEFASKKAFDNTSLMEKAQWKLKGLLESANIPFDPQGFDTTDALGKTLRLKIGVSSYENKPKNDVEEYLPA